MSSKSKLVVILLLAGALAALVVWLRAGHTATEAASARIEATSPNARSTDNLRTPETLGDPAALPGAAEDAALFVSGTVIDQDGHAVDGATITFDSGTVQAFESSVDGSFIADKLSARAYVVSARFEDAVSRPLRVVPKDSTTEITLKLVPSPALEVIAMSLRDDRPVSGATVRVEGETSHIVTTDASGRAVLRGVGAGTKVIRVMSSGYATALLPVEIPFEGRGQETLRVLLASAVVVSGVVQDETGRPIERAQIHAESVASISDTPVADRVLSDAQGRFSMPNLAPGLYRFRATHDEFATSVSAQQRIDERGASGVNLRMSAGGRVNGQVVSSRVNDTPIMVRFFAPDGGFGQRQFRDVACDKQGFFSARGLPRAALQAVAMRKRESSESTSINLQSTDIVSGVRLELSSGGSIHGVVVSQSETPIAAAIVSARPIDQVQTVRSRTNLQGPLVVTTDERGNFELVGLTAKQYAVFATPPDGASAGSRSAARDGYRVDVGMNIKLTLPDDGAVSGSVEFSDGRKPQNFTVSVDRSSPLSSTAPDGTFRLEAVPPGEHTLTISGEFPTKVVRGVQIPSGGVANVGKIVVQGGLALSGHVTTADGQPVASATVMVAQNFVGDGQSLASPGTLLETDQRHIITEADGSFKLNGLGPSARVIAAEHPAKGRAAARPLALNGAPIVLVLESTTSIEGRVTAGGKPVEGILLAATSRTPNPSEKPAQALGALSGPDGTYSIGNVPAGAYRIIAMKRKDGSASNGKVVDVNVIAKQASHVDIDLPAGAVTVVVRSEDKTERRLVMSGPSSQVGELRADIPARFVDVLPGEYRLCSMSLESSQEAETAANPSAKPCQSVRVAASPDVQEFTLN